MPADVTEVGARGPAIYTDYIHMLVGIHLFVGIVGGVLEAVLKRLGGRFGASWGLFSVSWGPHGASWGPLGVSRGPFGAEGPNVLFGFPLLGPSWGPLGPSWTPLGPSSGPLGPFWGRLGGLLCLLGVVLGASWAVVERRKTETARTPTSLKNIPAKDPTICTCE